MVRQRQRISYNSCMRLVSLCNGRQIGRPVRGNDEDFGIYGEVFAISTADIKTDGAVWETL